ncbi:MAG: hypothetical protein AAGG75_23235, partial [Bacteroidota bacterium]
MITKHIKYLAVSLILLLGNINPLMASLIETPLTWTINVGNEYIAAEALPGHTDGYLDFVWDGSLLSYGFYINQTPNGTSDLDAGLFLNTNGAFSVHSQ